MAKWAIFAPLVCLALAETLPPWAPIAGLGFLEGFLSDSPTDVDSCIGGLLQPFADVQNGFLDIKQGLKEHNLIDIVEGIESLGKLVKDLPLAMQTCKAAETDVKRIVQVLKEFHSLKDIIAHIKDDIKTDDKGQLAAQFELMVMSFEKKDYQDFGRHTAELLHRFLIGRYPGDEKPKKVAVLGTGLGAMSAMYYMTNYDGWEKDWDIDVYQMGWRIGGKAASGRTMRSESGSRVLEHGLHMFFVGYENAFQWVNDMYKAWTPAPESPIKTPDDAFKASCNVDAFVNLKNTTEPAEWALINQENPWNQSWMCMYKVPDKLQPASTPWKTFKQLVSSIATKSSPWYSDMVRVVADLIAGCRGPPTGQVRDQMLNALRTLQARAKVDLDNIESGNVETPKSWPPKGWCNAGQTGLPATKKACSIFLQRATYMELTIAAGFLADDILLQGCDREPIEFESIDTWICRHHGPCGLDQDDLIRGFPFSALFGFMNGNMHKPNVSAASLLCIGGSLDGSLSSGVGIGKGVAPSFRMQAGMGEVVMTPAYEVLKARGVRFHFFHKVEALHTSDGQTVDAIDINVQAHVKAGSATYDPLFTVQGLKVWPDLSTPTSCEGCDQFFDQLQEGATIRQSNVNLESYFSQWPGAAKKRLQLNSDFDLVVNGISSGALPYVTQDLTAKNTQWRTFIETTKTVATIALQVWTYNTTAELGYVLPHVDPQNITRTEVVASAGPEPYDTWADMTHLLKVETSNAKATAGVPKSVQYFCSPVEYDPSAANFSDTSVPAVQTERAYAAGVEWLEKYTKTILPKWADTVYESMVAPPGVIGRDRLRHQYWRLNFEPTELYVLSVAGSIKHRPVPWPSSPLSKEVHPFKNMAIVGDSSRNGFNWGCAEAAISSGVMAAHRLTGKKSPRRFVSYEHSLHLDMQNLDDPDHYPLVEADEIIV